MLREGVVGAKSCLDSGSYEVYIYLRCACVTEDTEGARIFQHSWYSFLSFFEMRRYVFGAFKSEEEKSFTDTCSPGDVRFSQRHTH